MIMAYILIMLLHGLLGLALAWAGVFMSQEPVKFAVIVLIVAAINLTGVYIGSKRSICHARTN